MAAKLENIESLYEPIQTLGQGTYGVVYLAKDLSTDNLVALKIILPKKGSTNFAAIKREVGLLSAIQEMGCNPNVICYYGFDRVRLDKKLVYVVAMEYIDGKDIWETFKPGVQIVMDGMRAHAETFTEEPLNPQIAYHLTSGLLNGLKFLHDNHIYHLDIKDENIMVNKNNLEPIYIDLGLGCKFDIPLNEYHACFDSFTGSLYYMSQARLECVVNAIRECPEEVNRGTDIFALGIVLYKVLTRHDIYDHEDPSVRYPILESWVNNAPEGTFYPYDRRINDVIKRALSQDPSVTVDELIRILDGPNEA